MQYWRMGPTPCVNRSQPASVSHQLGKVGTESRRVPERDVWPSLVEAMEKLPVPDAAPRVYLSASCFCTNRCNLRISRVIRFWAARTAAGCRLNADFLVAFARPGS